MNRKVLQNTLLLTIILLSIVTVSYAYSVISATTADQQSVGSTGAVVTLTYSDCASTNPQDCANISASLKPSGTISKTFEIENTGTVAQGYDIVFSSLKSTYLNDELVYTLENLDSGKILISEEPVPYSETIITNVFIKNEGIAVGQTKKYKLTVKFLNTDYDQVANENASFELKLGITGGMVISNSETTLKSLELTANSGAPDFNIKATTDEGVYAMEDDYGTSYYFRGAVENNYVKFADKYWRIVRINGDGSLRIIYDGTKAHENRVADTDRFIGTEAFNSSYDDNAYVGYMYGLTGVTTDANRCLMLDSETNTVVDNIGTYTTKEACEEAGGKWTTTAYEATHANVKSSTMKDYLETWYKDNILDKGYAGAVADTSFCGDRSIGTTYGTQLGYSKNETDYGARDRVATNNSPAFTCVRAEDKYTVNDLENGNGELKYPVGLITADEIVGAGGTWSEYNTQYYLYRDSHYWSMSPCYFDSEDPFPFMFTVHKNGDLFMIGAHVGYGVAPVINLTSEYVYNMIGTGKIDDPYRVN